MRLQEHLGATNDHFTYVMTYVSDFPAEDQMSSERAVNDLIRMIREGLSICRNHETKHWLTLSLEAMFLAQQCLKFADESGLEKQLNIAFGHFDKARKRKKIAARFVVGSDGQTTRAPES